jgi:pimeloyl-ACP methyl ester carboxylesterase
VKLEKFVCAAIALSWTAGTAVFAAADPAKQGTGESQGFGRAEVTSIIADARRIVSANGVEELLEIPVADTKQWISVRGRDRRNPLLLMIHGGPASPEMPTSWAFQSGWEDFFTVVQWDQRGAGKSFGANDPATIGPTLSLERITEDAGEVVRYLRQRYAKEKIFVLGHSWGSVVGLNLASRHPEWLFGYVGMGQIISGKENERASYALTLRAAEAAGNAQAESELRALAPYPEDNGTLSLDKLEVERKWVVALGGLSNGRDGLGYYLNLAYLSPEYTTEDIEAMNKGSHLSLSPLWADVMRFDYGNTTRFHCPIILFAGRHDHTTPSDVAAAWLKRVRAPRKQIIWFENSAHMMMVEEPGQVLVHLVNDVRPLAR